MRIQRRCSPISSFPGKTATSQVVPRFLRKNDNPLFARISPHFQPRIALYSGGKSAEALRRNIAVAHALKKSHLKANVLLISEPHNDAALTPPKGLTCVGLPPSTEPGQPPQLALEALAGFKPDAVVVDDIPFGLKPELDAVISLLQRGNTRCILGLGDSPTHTIPEQAQRLYDQIWAYGDRNLYDFAREYNFSNATRKKVHYTGYLDGQSLGQAGDQEATTEDLIVFTLGESEDYANVCETLIATPLPRNSKAILIAGPGMPSHVKNGLKQLAALQENFEVVNHGPGTAGLLARSSRIIAMGNNSTLSEALASDRPTLLIPTRQRACHALERLARLNIADVMSASDLSTKAISNWLCKDIPDNRPSSKQHVDFNGLTRLPGLLGTLLTSDRRQPSRQAF